MCVNARARARMCVCVRVCVCVCTCVCVCVVVVAVVAVVAAVVVVVAAAAAVVVVVVVNCAKDTKILALMRRVASRHEAPSSASCSQYVYNHSTVAMVCCDRGVSDAPFSALSFLGLFFLLACASLHLFPSLPQRPNIYYMICTRTHA